MEQDNGDRIIDKVCQFRSMLWLVKLKGNQMPTQNVTELTRGVARSANARLRQNRTPKSNLYLIEEPSIGLHALDVVTLLRIIHRVVDDGHTIVVIEHNLEIMAEADFLIEIGPEGGEQGGRIVASGKPEKVILAKESRTAPYLGKLIE